MKSHFIEGTNQQYSIREDGIVIRHYKYRGRKEYNKIVTEDVIIEYKKHPTRNCNYIVIRSNNTTFNWFKNVLLSKYFNIIICPKCENIIDTDSHIRICTKCVKNNETQTRLKWRENNKEKVKSSTRKSYKKNYPEYQKCILEKARLERQRIDKSYVSSKLGLSISELTDDIYNLYKANLKLKRLLSKKTGISTNLIK